MRDYQHLREIMKIKNDCIKDCGSISRFRKIYTKLEIRKKYDEIYAKRDLKLKQLR